MRQRKRLISVVLLIIILLGAVPQEVVYGADANFMGASMINFFKAGQEDLEVGTIKASELRVYGVFLSNFFTPGETRISDMSSKGGGTGALAGKVSKVFFGGEGNKEKVGEINNKVYEGILGELTSGKLYNSAGVAMTGEGLLKAMTATGKGGKVYRNKTQEVIDFQNVAFRGAYKILAAQSAGFIFDTEYGVAGMTSLYIDAFGNIWGSYPAVVKTGEKVDKNGSTELADMHLVMPACLNPVSFLNTGGGASLSNARVPLNNSFAMGSLVDSTNIGAELSEDNLVPYYNIPKYLGAGDKENALFIYGINSPFNYIYNTDKIPKTESAKAKLDAFFKGGYTNVSNYKLVMSNRLDVMEDTLTSHKNWFVANAEKAAVVEYLYGTVVLGVEKTITDIYYFGEGGNAAWAESTFEEVGMVGANMFGSLQKGGDTPNTKSDDVWLVHDSNQKATKVTRLMEERRGEVGVTPEGVRKALGVAGDYTVWNTAGLTPPDKSVVSKIDTTVLNPFEGAYFIHGVSPKTDSKVYGKLKGIIESKDFTGRATNYTVYGGSQEEVLFHNMHTYAVSGAKLTAEKERAGSITVTKSATETKDLTITNNRVGTEANWPGIFWGYMVEMLDMKDMVKVGADGKSVYDIREFESSYLPTLPYGVVSNDKIDLTPLDGESGVSNSEELTMEEMQKDLVKKIYGIVSDEPNEYRNSWMKSTLDGFIISTHKAITGSWLSNIATVSSENATSYSSVVGYIHTPALQDLPFTAWIMNNYMEIYVLAILLILALLLFMVLLNMRTWQQGLLIFMLMSICVLLPNILVDNTINIGNKVADTIYSERFDFWALTQHQQSFKSLKGAVDTGSLDTLLNVTGEKAKNVYSQDAGVRIKWMAPKKSGVFTSLFDRAKITDNLATNLTVFKWLFSSFVYEQEFVSSDPFATYLYRPYNAIAADAEEYYKLAQKSMLLDSAKKEALSMEYTNRKKKSETREVQSPVVINKILEKCDSAYAEKYKEYFYGSTVWGNKELLKTDNVFDIYWNERKYQDIIEETGQYPKIKPEEKTSVSLWGLGQEKVTEVILTEGRLGERTGPDLPKLDATLTDTSDIELLGFYKNTESPYYYFYNTLKTRYGGSSGETFKNALLNSDIFVVRRGNIESSTRKTSNKVRDFLDLEGLFTNVVPYMSISNEYVRGWTSVYGTSVPEFAFPEEGKKEATTETTDEDDLLGDYADELRTDEEKTEAMENATVSYAEMRERKEGMETVWGMYCPWVDQINSLGVHNKKAGIGGKNVNIENTLNPSYYLKAGRPMVFSEADMVGKGYRESDLTDIEVRMQRVLETTYQDMQYLVNYYDMDNEVLVTAAAMYATFNFNREFSQTEVLGESVMLYPQGFEMKNFNYDAFMRLVLLNSTGETVFAEKGDLYDRVMAKTSFITGLLLLVTDILGVILIPALKLIILVMILFLGLLVCIACVVSPPEKIVEAVMQSVVLPAMLFLASNIVFAFVVSLLVGEGLTAYVGSKGMSVVTNDPTITIALMIIVNAVYCIVLYNLMKRLAANYKVYGVVTAIASGGILGETVRTGGKGIGRLMQGFRGGAGRVGGLLGGAAVGGIMTGKGGRLRGMFDGAVTGRGSAVYRERRGESRQADATARVLSDFGTKLNAKANGTYVEPDIATSGIPNGDTGEVGGLGGTSSSGAWNVGGMQGGTKLGQVLGGAVVAKHFVDGGVIMAKENIRDGIKGVGTGVRVATRYASGSVDAARSNIGASIRATGDGVRMMGEQARDYVTPNQMRRGITYAGTTIKGVADSMATSTKAYVGESLTQARQVEEEAKGVKVEMVNGLYTRTRGYDYETLQKAKGEGGADRKERRAAAVTVRRADAKEDRKQERTVEEKLAEIQNRKRQN